MYILYDSSHNDNYTVLTTTNLEGVDRGKDESPAALVNMDAWEWNRDLLAPEWDSGCLATSASPPWICNSGTI